MEVWVSRSDIKGRVQVPASKSLMQRACAAALLRKGKTVIENPGISMDDGYALKIIEQLGAKVIKRNGEVEIQSEGVHPQKDEIDCGESGLSCRMFCSIAALSNKLMVVKGSGSLVKRPMEFFEDVLPLIGVVCRTNDGKLPMVIKGPMNPQDITIDGSLSSQYLTGLLMAFSASGAEGVKINVNSLTSRSYIDLTMEVMGEFGMSVPVNHDYSCFEFLGSQQTQTAKEVVTYKVEGDWSSASFLMVAGALFGWVVIEDIALKSLQGDRKIVEVLENAGAIIESSEGMIKVSKGDLRSFEFDATDCPDLFPPLVALACYCKGESVIKGVERLFHKESNRAMSLKTEFEKAGAKINISGERMYIDGGRSIYGTRVDSHHDHRIAMALGLAGLGAEGKMVINGAEAVEKSYPDFWKDLMKIGGRVERVMNDE